MVGISHFFHPAGLEQVSFLKAGNLFVEGGDLSFVFVDRVYIGVDGGSDGFYFSIQYYLESVKEGVVLGVTFFPEALEQVIITFLDEGPHVWSFWVVGGSHLVKF